MRDFSFDPEKHFIFDPMDNVLRNGDTSQLLQERTDVAKGLPYSVSEERLSGFIAWAATEIVGYHLKDQTSEYLYTILPTLIQLRDLLRIAEKRPQVALSLEKALYDEEGKRKRSALTSLSEVEAEEAWKLWRKMIESVQRTDEERKRDKDLLTYLFRLMIRLRKHFHDHWYRSYEQAIYCLLDPETLAVHYVGMAHDVRRRYRRHLENRDGTPMKREWIGGLLARNLDPLLDYLERGPEASYYAEEREFRWIRHHLQIESPLTNREASPHLIQACQSTTIDFLTVPLDIVSPSPIWWPIFVAQAQDEMDRSLALRKIRRASNKNSNIHT